MGYLNSNVILILFCVGVYIFLAVIGSYTAVRKKLTGTPGATGVPTFALNQVANDILVYVCVGAVASP